MEKYSASHAEWMCLIIQITQILSHCSYVVNTHIFLFPQFRNIYIYFFKKGKDLLRNQKVVVWEKYLFLPIITCDFYLQEKQENL